MNPPIDENTLRLGVFALIFAAMALLEALFPRRSRAYSRTARWFTNIAMSAVSTLSLRLAAPFLAIAAATQASERGWGLLNVVALPAWLEGLLALVLLDMLIYWQHVASHKFGFLWALHQVHHSDRDIDVSTGIRFHPLEIILSMIYKVVCVAALGAPAFAVFIFELLLNGCSLFNHANLRLPEKADTWLRYLVVTPDMHRIHHSATQRETDSNYGFSISLWDRIFHSYSKTPELGQNNMRIGLPQYQTDDPCSLVWSLLLPLQRRSGTQGVRR